MEILESIAIRNRDPFNLKFAAFFYLVSIKIYFFFFAFVNLTHTFHYFNFSECPVVRCRSAGNVCEHLETITNLFRRHRVALIRCLFYKLFFFLVSWTRTAIWCKLTFRRNLLSLFHDFRFWKRLKTAIICRFSVAFFWIPHSDLS